MALGKALMVLFVTILLMMSSVQVLSAENTQVPKSITGRKLAQSTYGDPGGGGCSWPNCGGYPGYPGYPPGSGGGYPGYPPGSGGGYPRYPPGSGGGYPRYPGGRGGYPGYPGGGG